MWRTDAAIATYLPEMPRTPLLSLLALLSALVFAADAAAEWRRVLLPIYFDGEIAGAFGSRWTLELSGYNGSNTQHLITANPERRFETPNRCGCTVGPGELFAGARFLHGDRRGAGRFLYIATNGADETERLALSLRTRDLSRESESHGIEVPVVREHDVITGRPIALTNIPTGPLYRQKLRVYDFDGELGRAVTVEVYKAAGRRHFDRLATYTLHLSLAAFSGEPHHPGYAELDLNAMPELSGVDRVTVLVKGSTDARLWAFVSVTNNDTQQVTTVTPM